MAGYIRQSSFVDGDTITAALFNNEYNQLVNAFSNTTGHKHDGTTAEGPVIGLIGDAGETSPNNKVLIDTTNNYIEFYVEVSSAPVQQLYIADGAIVPVTDSDVDLGTSSLYFKNTYTDTVTTTGDVTVGGNLTVTGNATISGNLTFGDADTDSINLAAEIDSDIIPNTDGTYDLGSATKEWQDLYIDGTANIDSLVADTADIDGGTIDGATIATSDITVGAGKTLDVSSGTLTLADDQISGDKVEGGTIAATTITTLTSTTGNVTNVNATTVDTTNIEVTNIKAKDGTAAGSIADSTGVVTLASSVLTTTDINGGTIDGTTIATSDITVGAAKTLDVSAGTLTLADNQISGDKVEGGTIAATTITDLTFGSLNDGTITVTAFVDEDNMVSDSATLVPTQQSVKAYVDSQVTAQDLDFQGDTGGALSIDLDSETLTVAGGTGIDTSGALNTLTVAIDSTVATLTDTQTLTNKTLTSPVINTGVSGTAVLDDDTFATATATTLATSESIKAYVDTTVAATNEVVEDSTPQLGGDLDTNGNDILFADNDKAIFGAGSDLKIYHDGTSSNSYFIESNATGNMEFRASSIRLKEGDGGNYYFLGVAGGASTIYHSGSPKLATTSTGIDVTGTATMDGLTVDGGGILRLNSSSTTDFFTITQGGTQAVLTADSPDGAANMIFRTTVAGVDNDRMLISASGDISFYDDTGTSQALFWDASAESLGIGTTSPDGDLDVRGAGLADLVIRATSADSTSRLLMRNDAQSFALRINGDDKFRIKDETADVDRLVVDTAGNVGIGVTPSAKLHVSDSDANLVALFERTTTGSNSPIAASRSVAKTSVNAVDGFGSLHAFSMQDDTSARQNLGYIGAVRSGADNTGSIVFLPVSGGTATEHMRIDSSGNVGIGTTSPAEKLSIEDGDIIVQNDTKVTFGYRGASASTALAFRDRFLGADRLTIDSSGNVGIGTASPSKNLHIQGGQTELLIEGTNSTVNTMVAGVSVKAQYYRKAGLTIYDESDNEDFFIGRPYASTNQFAIINDGSERLRIDSSGNLLVGKTTASLGTTGVELKPAGIVRSTRAGYVAEFNRITNDGEIVNFKSSGTTVGSIGTSTGRITVLNNDSHGFRIGTTSANPDILPMVSGSLANGAGNLGQSNYRWKDLYLAGTAKVDSSAYISQGALTSSSNAVAWDAAAKANAYYATTENTTFSAPTNAVEGAIISVEIAQGATPYTVAWNTVFEFAASTAPTVTATANKTDIFSFRYNGSVWQEIGRTQNMAQT